MIGTSPTIHAFTLSSGLSFVLCMFAAIFLTVSARWFKRILGLDVDAVAVRTAHNAGGVILTLFTFVLALTLNDARTTFERVESQVRYEALLARQIESNLQVLRAGGDAEASRACNTAMQKYVMAVSASERESSASRSSMLHDEASEILEQIRGIAIRLASDSAGQRLLTDVVLAEQCRQERLIDAQGGSKTLFWILAALLFFVAMVLFDAGAFGFHGFTASILLAIAVGAVVGITVEFENPYEGFVRVLPLEIFYSLRVR